MFPFLTPPSHMGPPARLDGTVPKGQEMMRDRAGDFSNARTIDTRSHLETKVDGIPRGNDTPHLNPSKTGAHPITFTVEKKRPLSLPSLPSGRDDRVVTPSPYGIRPMIRRVSLSLLLD
jgi:hypothetical protein